ncbi:MAG: GNAT family N-acetyltransferase, partial [Deltaproteobacteria bacterium]
LLADAMRRVAAAIRNTAGVVGWFVDAKNQNVAAFYEKFGFIPLRDNPFSLMLPQQTILGLFPHKNNDM